MILPSLLSRRLFIFDSHGASLVLTFTFFFLFMGLGDYRLPCRASCPVPSAVVLSRFVFGHVRRRDLRSRIERIFRRYFGRSPPRRARAERAGGCKKVQSVDRRCYPRTLFSRRRRRPLFWFRFKLLTIRRVSYGNVFRVIFPRTAGLITWLVI